MAKGRKTGGRDFQKGHKFSPGGKPLSEEQKKLRKALPRELAERIDQYFGLSIGELKELMKDKSLPVLNVCVVRCLIDYLNKGDWNRHIEPLLNRSIGKPKQFIEHSGSLDMSVNRKARIQELLDKRDGTNT